MRRLIFTLTLAVLSYAVLAVPNFATSFNISQAIAGASERALIVLPMVLLIIAREMARESRAFLLAGVS